MLFCSIADFGMNAQQVNVLKINEPTVFYFLEFDAQFAHVVTTTGN
jgi:hypothetical protein